MKPINFPIQINGKMRGTLTVPAGISEQELLALVHADETISKYLTGTNKKIIFVADKIMNIINS
jgi:leucyl-tRNA synthetase